MPRRLTPAAHRRRAHTFRDNRTRAFPARAARSTIDRPCRPRPPSAPKPQTSTPQAGSASREATFDIFRRWGYLQASLDPLGQYLAPEPFPTPAPDGPDAEEARRYYCGTVGAEFMHIPSPEKRAWIQQRLERDYTTTPFTDAARAHILTGLIKADVFEQVIQQRYLGTKRFSLEGLTATHSLSRPGHQHCV